MDDEQRCSKRAFGSGHPFRGTPCKRPGKETWEGRMLCAVHLAAAKRGAKQREESNERWRQHFRMTVLEGEARTRVLARFGLTPSSMRVWQDLEGVLEERYGSWTGDLIGKLHAERAGSEHVVHDHASNA